MTNNPALYPTSQEIDSELVRYISNKIMPTKDQTTKVFAKDVLIDQDNLELLNRDITEKLKMNNCKNLSVEIDIKYENRRQDHFSSWLELEKYKWNEVSPISNIVITWKYLINLDNFDVIPQNYEITVKLSNGIRPEEMMNLIFGGNLNEITEFENNFFPVIAQCTFSNRSFGNEILNVIGEWVDNVERSAFVNHKIIKFSKRHAKKIAKVSEYVFFIAFMYLPIGVLREMLTIDFLISDFKKAFTYLGVMFIFWNIIPRISRIIGRTIFTWIREFGVSYIFALTKYDKQRQQKMQMQNRYDMIKIIIGIIINFIISVWGIFWG